MESERGTASGSRVEMGQGAPTFVGRVLGPHGLRFTRPVVCRPAWAIWAQQWLPAQQSGEE